MADILIFGYGNPSRGDDALGPRLLEHLTEQLTPDIHHTAGGIECLTDFQLQIEHALDLIGRKLVLFVDAHASCPPPYRLEQLQPATTRTYTTHAQHPAAVLRVYEDIHSQPAPPSFLLGIRGERFELGEELSNAAQAHLVAAVDLVLRLCAEPSLAFWQTQCHGSEPPIS